MEFKHTTNPEHLCPGHKAILEWSPETFLKEASEVHEDAELYIRKILEEKRYVDQVNKTCSGEFATAVAHELGHSHLSLKHPFDKTPGLAEGDLPDNLMDYRNGRELAKWQ